MMTMTKKRIIHHLTYVHVNTASELAYGAYRNVFTLWHASRPARAQQKVIKT